MQWAGSEYRLTSNETEYVTNKTEYIPNTTESPWVKINWNIEIDRKIWSMCWEVQINVVSFI